jgi:hypothetical protein
MISALAMQTFWAPQTRSHRKYALHLEAYNDQLKRRLKIILCVDAERTIFLKNTEEYKEHHNSNTKYLSNPSK